MKGLGISLHLLRPVSFRVDGNEQRRHVGVRGKLVERRADLGEFRRTDVGAEGKAEIDQQILAFERFGRARPAVAVDEGERSADPCLADDGRTSALERAVEGIADPERDQQGQHDRKQQN